MEASPTYADGMRDGQIKAIEDMQSKQNLRMDSHSKRIGNLERVAWCLLGVVGFIQMGPVLQSWLS